MDFLGLRNLDVIEDAVEIIKRSHDIEVDVGTPFCRSTTTSAVRSSRVVSGTRVPFR